jgi:hypothetical protein
VRVRIERVIAQLEIGADAPPEAELPDPEPEGRGGGAAWARVRLTAQTK